jgi:hypothetical protein
MKAQGGGDVQLHFPDYTSLAPSLGNTDEQ